jgi:hypothetical protein
MNQPMGSCHSHFREVVNLAEELRKHRKQHDQFEEGQPNLHREEDNLADLPQAVLEPSEFGEMEIDNQLPVEVEGSGHASGPIIEVFEGASKTYGKGTTFMAKFDYDRFANERTANLYYPFASREEWEVASFLLCSSLSMHDIDTVLSLNPVRLEFHWKIGS